jgi:hypothetical protein
MIFLRLGPRFLFLRTHNPEKLKEFLVSKLKGEVMVFEDAFDKSGDNNSLIFITDVGPIETRVEDAIYIIMVPDKSSIILAEIINDNASDYVHRIDIGPGFLLVKVSGNNSDTIDKLRIEYKGEELSIKAAITKGELNDTIIAFTDKPLRDVNSSSDLLDRLFLVAKPVSILENELKRRIIRLTTESLEDEKWYELKVNIFDAEEYYEKHLERLSTTLTDIDGGLILGESWTKDYALGLLFVQAYQVWIFTIKRPQEFKKILIGLEYNDEGKRFVDFDLYYKKDKIRWVSAKTETKITRQELGMLLRKELFNSMSKAAVVNLLEIERDIKRIAKG